MHVHVSCRLGYLHQLHTHKDTHTHERHTHTRVCVCVCVKISFFGENFTHMHGEFLYLDMNRHAREFSDALPL